MHSEFLAVVQRQGVSHLSGYWLEGADGGMVQGRHRLVRQYLCRKHFCLPVNKCRYIGLFTGAFYGIPLLITHPGLLFSYLRAFIDGDTVTYLTAMVFYSLSMTWFCLFLPEMLFHLRVFRRFPVQTGVDDRW
jgi:hypothetical protein